jgi:hypothetical protein
VAIAGYAASFLPRVYAESNFWTSSPTFFFLRVGILLTLLPIAYGWNRFVTGRSPLREFGVASLFVYWIHVEMVYGVLSAPLHKQLSLEQAVVAFAAFSLFLFGLVKLKDAIPWRELSEPVTKSFDDFFRMSFKTPSSTSSSRSPRD